MTIYRNTEHRTVQNQEIQNASQVESEHNDLVKLSIEKFGKDKEKLEQSKSLLRLVKVTESYFKSRYEKYKTDPTPQKLKAYRYMEGEFRKLVNKYGNLTSSL